MKKKITLEQVKRKWNACWSEESLLRVSNGKQEVTLIELLESNLCVSHAKEWIIHNAASPADKKVLIATLLKEVVKLVRKIPVKKCRYKTKLIGLYREIKPEWLLPGSRVKLRAKQLNIIKELQEIYLAADYSIPERFTRALWVAIDNTRSIRDAFSTISNLLNDSIIFPERYPLLRVTLQYLKKEARDAARKN